MGTMDGELDDAVAGHGPKDDAARMKRRYPYWIFPALYVFLTLLLTYPLQVGLYHPDTLARIPAVDGAGNVSGDSISIATLKVTAGRRGEAD
jgi:hypothetical protein